MNCRLCNVDTKLENSHIIPSFVYKWIKRTSITGGIRNSDDPNVRKQDGDKLPFLCGKCEDKFQVFEEYFQKEIFSKATKDKLMPFIIEEKCIGFCVSILWRCLKYRIVENKKMDELTSKELGYLNQFLIDCEDFFNKNEYKFIEKYKIHIIPTTEEMEDRGMIPKVTFENQRGTDYSFRAFCKEEEGFDYLLFYTKIPYFLFVVEIIENQEKIWENTSLSLGEMSCEIDKMKYPEIVKEILQSIYDNKERAKKKMTKVQIDKLSMNVSKALDQNPKKINSGSIKAMKRR